MRRTWKHRFPEINEILAQGQLGVMNLKGVQKKLQPILDQEAFDDFDILDLLEAETIEEFDTILDDLYDYCDDNDIKVE